MACRRLALMVIAAALLAGGLVALASASPPSGTALTVTDRAICRESPDT